MLDFDLLFLTDASVDAIRDVLRYRGGDHSPATTQLAQLGEFVLREIGLFDGLPNMTADQEASLREFAAFRGAFNHGASHVAYEGAIVAYFSTTNPVEKNRRKRALDWLREGQWRNPKIPPDGVFQRELAEPFTQNSFSAENMVATKIVDPTERNLAPEDFAVLPDPDPTRSDAAYDALVQTNKATRDAGGYFVPPPPEGNPGEAGAPGGETGEPGEGQGEGV